MMSDSVDIYECGESRERGRRQVAIVLKRDQLLYDIENYLYIEGDLVPEESQHQRHMMQDVGDVGNVDRVTRVLDMAHADIVERLYPFTQHGIYNAMLDDRLREKPAYGIFLSVPETYSQTTLNLLGKLIHELLVCEAVADWLSITNVQKEEVWRRKVGQVVQRINEIRSFRRDRSRIRPHWIG